MTPIVLRHTLTLRFRLLSLLGSAIVVAVSVCVFLAFGRPAALSEVVFGFCTLAGFVALAVLFHPDQLWTLDEDKITVRKRIVFYRYTRSWPMRLVASVRVRAGDGEEPRDTRYVELRLASGKRLTLPPCKGRDRCDDIARQIEAWSQTR